jgi:hypothetical protein
MLYVSLMVNVIVLVPVCIILLRNGQAAERAWGAKTDGRSILLAVYFTILLFSGLLLIAGPNGLLPIVHTLLMVQITYKLISVITVGIGSPVVISNIAISMLHSGTIYLTI